MSKKVLTMFLALAIVLGMLPMAAFAGDDVVSDPIATALGVEGVDGVYTLAKATELSNWLPINTNCTIDLNGQTLTLPGENKDIEVRNGATLTIRDGSATKAGTINSQLTGNWCAILVYPGTTLNFESGTLKAENGQGLGTLAGDNKFWENSGEARAVINVSGGKIETKKAGIVAMKNAQVTISGGEIHSTDYPAVSGNGLAINAGADITITSGTLTSDANAGIYHPQNGALKVSGGNVTGKAGIVARSGSVEVTGGTVTATGTGNLKVGDSQVDVPADGVVFDAKAEYPNSTAQNAKISIKGDATVKAQASQKAVTLVAKDDDDSEATDKIEISGGAFNVPVDTKYLAENLKYQAKTEGGEYSYHVTQEEAEAAAGVNGTISAKTEGDEMEPVIKVKGAGFIWDIDDEAAQEAVRVLGGTVGGDWIDQTMYVVLDQPLGDEKFAWISAEIGGETWGCACVGNNTSRTYAFSFLNLGQMEQKPEDASPEGLSGETAINAKISVYKTETQLTAAPADLTSLPKIGEEPVAIGKKPDNANPNLKVENVATDVSTYAKVTVSGMLEGKVYAVRFAQSATQPTDMTIIILEGEETHDFYTQGGQKIWVFELNNKSDLVPGEDNKLHYTSLVEHTAAKVLS